MSVNTDCEPATSVVSLIPSVVFANDNSLSTFPGVCPFKLANYFHTAGKHRGLFEWVHCSKESKSGATFGWWRFKLCELWCIMGYVSGLFIA